MGRASLALFLAILLSPVRAARAASADPSLMPEFDDRRRAPAPAPAARRPAPAPDAIPLPPSASDIYRRPERFNEERPPHRPYVVLRSWLWLTSGSLDTRYNVQVPPALVSPPGVEVFLGETQKHGANGLMVVDSAELSPVSWLSFEFEFGTDRPRKGSDTDHYWIHAPGADRLTYLPTGATWHKPDHEDDLVYAADANSFRDWISATMYFRVLASAVDSPESFKLRHAVDLGVGAERFRQNTRMTNLSLIQNNNKYYAPGLPPGPLAGYDSTYDAYWRGPHIALRDEVSGAGFSLEGLALYSPLMEFYGQGFDNFLVSSGRRAAAPNYADWAHGTAVHFFLAAGWEPFKGARLEAGYQRLYFFSRTGKRRYYNANGTVSDVQLDTATAEIGGFFGGGSLRF